ncbi:hypothetical protein V500_00761 [Pseudogymnoascus sp. VKM F-4518 (FW-2643)]|nr:hypothetical protein V500_00761 [Pseudogymnoascus sp. VKM F-4518 (FW-2643)]
MHRFTELELLTTFLMYIIPITKISSSDSTVPASNVSVSAGIVFPASEEILQPNVTVVEGDSTSPAPIFSKYGPIYGVFVVTTPGKEGAEEAQATAMIKEAAKSGVEHFVFTSVDRGGAGRSEDNSTDIRQFASKLRIEELLKEKSSGSKMQWTILRPVSFMDNLSPDFTGRVFAVLWADLGDKPLQLISVHDVGISAARAFADMESYKGRAISLAGDALTLAEAKKVFKESLGYKMPETFGFMGWVIKFFVKELGTMFAWFKDEGYGADIQALREEEPRLQDFGTWLKETSQFSKK